MIRCIDILGRTLAKPRIRELCKALELEEHEVNFITYRCIEKRSREFIYDWHNMTLRQQATYLESVNNKVWLWINQHPEFFSTKELNVLHSLFKSII